MSYRKASSAGVAVAGGGGESPTTFPTKEVGLHSGGSSSKNKVHECSTKDGTSKKRKDTGSGSGGSGSTKKKKSKLEKQTAVEVAQAEPEPEGDGEAEAEFDADVSTLIKPVVTSAPLVSGAVNGKNGKNGGAAASGTSGKDGSSKKGAAAVEAAAASGTGAGAAGAPQQQRPELFKMTCTCPHLSNHPKRAELLRKLVDVRVEVK